MRNKSLLVLLLCTVSFYSQQNLKFKINGLQDTTVFLARYFGDKLYYADTAYSKNGTVVFNKKEFVGGIYAVVCPESRYFEFIMANEDVELETDILDFNGKMKIKKSENNKLFYEYISFLGSMKERSKTLQGDDSKTKREALDLEVKQYQKNNILNKELLAAKVLAMSVDPEIPEEIKENDSLRYRFYLDHYWDNIDVTDSRIVHTPVYHKKLDFFFKKMIPQIPDTICKYAHNLISQIDEETDLFKYTVHHLTYKYETSNIMGMDAVFVCMAQKYYCPANDSKSFWLDSNKIVDLCDKAEKTAPLLIGKKAPRLILADTSETNWIDFYQLPNKYNLLIFWDPDCGHCKKEIPKMENLYKEFKEKGIDIEFIAVGTNLENEKWIKYVKNNELPWINISDFPDANKNAKEYIYEKRITTLESLNFRSKYDIFSTPQVYLVDSEKKIIGKKLNALSLGKMMEHLEEVDIDYLETLEKQNKEEKEKIENSKKKNNKD